MRWDVFEGQSYTQDDLDGILDDAQRSLTRLQYEEALALYKKAREVAWSLSAPIHFGKLDRIIRRVRDQMTYHAQLIALMKNLASETNIEAQFAELQQLGQVIGLLSAMAYQDLGNTARAMRSQFIANLTPERAQELAQRAAGVQDYRLVLDLLEGLHLDDGAVASKLFRRVQGAMISEIAPLLQQADECLTQSRPLDALGPLRDLRKAYPSCTAWREPWFAAARIQGEFLLKRGRGYLSELQYKSARSTFIEASRTFARGAEAYPKASSIQMLLTEAHDLSAIAQDLGSAYQCLEAHKDMEALQDFDAIHGKLLAWEKEQREYTQLKYELMLMQSRLREKMEQEQKIDEGESLQVQVPVEQQIHEEDPVAQEPMQPAETQGIELRRLVRALRIAVEDSNFQQGWELFEKLESAYVDFESLDLYEKILQAGSRLDKGRELFEKGDVDAAIVRFKSAADLVENLPEADLLVADAQMWLDRAQSQRAVSKPSAALIPASISEPGDANQTPETRLVEWVLEIDPSLDDARAAFIRGDFEVVQRVFVEISERFMSQQAPLGISSTIQDQGDEP